MNKTTIVTGYYGSGKTEFCINYALELRKRLAASKPFKIEQNGEALNTSLGTLSEAISKTLVSTAEQKIYIADLDVINPYFRSREKADYLERHNIQIVGNALGNNVGQDIPALSFNFLPLIKKGERVILDLAGGENGLNVLAGCYSSISSYEFLCVFNLYREETNNVEKMIHFVNKINSISKLPITGIVNNGNMLHETNSEHILSSQKAILGVCQELNIPFRYTLVKNSVYRQVKDKILSDEVMVFNELKMREKWQ